MSNDTPPECCGFTRGSPYCPQCGRNLTSTTESIHTLAIEFCRTFTRIELCRCERLPVPVQPCVACRLRDLVFDAMEEAAVEKRVPNEEV
jgi:hypothetical protein